MIITRLNGGLGNQMFQYAFGKSLAENLQTPLKLDLSVFATPLGSSPDTPRTYELNRWNTHAEIATQTEIQRFAPLREGKTSFIQRLFKHSSDLVYYKEKRFRFDAGAFQLQGAVYLDGYWQSEKYFADHADSIRTAFTPLAALHGLNKELAFEMADTCSVSIHVRRSDYQKDKTTLDFHGLCPLAYYKDAVALLRQKYKHIHLYVFSDDQQWSAENIQFDIPTTHIVHNRGAESYLDLWLMSRCKHHVLANSSFSWWGAWLNENPLKTVIAPRRWFAGTVPDTSDLIPASWTCL